MSEKRPSKKDFRKMALMSSLGLMLPSSIAVGLVFGYFLDKLLNTSPWLFLTFMILGTVSGFLSFIRGLNKIKNEDEDEDEGNEKR